MERPESVSRVTPPTTSRANTTAAVSHSQMATGVDRSERRKEVMARGLSLCDCLGHTQFAHQWGESMSGVGVFSAVVIGILAGWIAERVMKRNHGLFTNLIVGVIGSFIGAFIAGRLHIIFYGWIGSLVVSTVGAIVLLAVLGLFRRR